MLRAGLSRATGISPFILGSPKGWLGSAYHEVLEKIPRVDLATESLDNAIERLWSQAIAAQHQRASRHPLDRRFGSPVTWPGYHVARASVRLRAGDLVTFTVAAPVAATGPGAFVSATIREQEFIACNGKLVGRPDVVRADEVVDYKSGGLFEYDENSQVEVVKSAYVRQLRIYGYLVKEALGSWPIRGLLLPLAGTGVEVSLHPAECEQEVLEAIALLDAYNAKVRAQARPAEFAAPSPAACKWCPYKLICPAFWQAASPAWSGHLDGAAVEGTVPEAPRSIHGGAALAITVDVQAGSEGPRRAEIAPLNPAVHSSIATVGVGDHVRFVSLRVRPDGVLTPTSRTILVRVADVPSLGIAGRYHEKANDQG
ncbi:MAG: PD-(D/E)XK nuclease family protein [Planctomycetes bacterium]|nr:PD-(D/E)XK nuclease family protein [Planctomycetota bacterium]